MNKRPISSASELDFPKKSSDVVPNGSDAAEEKKLSDCFSPDVSVVVLVKKDEESDEKSDAASYGKF